MKRIVTAALVLALGIPVVWAGELSGVVMDDRITVEVDRVADDVDGEAADAAGQEAEDAGVVDGYLSAGGVLTATDVDGPDNTFTPGSHRGTYGELTIDGSGSWTYSVDNSLPAIQGLADGSSIDDVIAVASIDGTTHDITITITGNTAPLGVDDPAYAVDEDGILTAGWWDSDWTRLSTITIDNSGQGELLDMPVLVVLTITFAGLWFTGRAALAEAADPLEIVAHDVHTLLDGIITGTSTNRIGLCVVLVSRVRREVSTRST